MRHGNPGAFSTIRVVAAAAAAACMATAQGASAAVVVSSAATQNMSCSGGVCAPTASAAVLNAGDLETLLASGNLAVETTGQGVQAKDIEVEAPVIWSSGSVLTLDAYRSIAIDQPVSVASLAGLALVTNDGKKGNSGTLSFGPKGNATFANLSSSLSIDGAAFTLVGDLKTLAADIAANPNGNFALADSYDASGDGTYDQSVVPTEYEGTFTGLGNVVSNLSIAGANERDVGNGMFALVGSSGVLENIGLANADVAVGKAKYAAAGLLAGANLGVIAFATAKGSVTVKKSTSAGGLVGANGGTITHSNAEATVTAEGSGTQVGGLVGINNAMIGNSRASGAISVGSLSEAGGLVGENSSFGAIQASYATGSVRGRSNSHSYDISAFGGLVGLNESSVSSCYAAGPVRGGSFSDEGGLVGHSYSPIESSYSTGTVNGGDTGSVVGGLIGVDDAAAGNLTSTYWDTDTSGIANLAQGAGQPANDPGITGLTTAQFQSGLPIGFDPKVWAENAKINEGFPYLRNNPPRKR